MIHIELEQKLDHLLGFGLLLLGLAAHVNRAEHPLPEILHGLLIDRAHHDFVLIEARIDHVVDETA